VEILLSRQLKEIVMLGEGNGVWTLCSKLADFPKCNGLKVTCTGDGQVTFQKVTTLLYFRYL
jgi:hypothetical protein